MSHASTQLPTTPDPTDDPLWFQRRSERIRRMAVHAMRRHHYQRASMLDLMAHAYKLLWRSKVADDIDNALSVSLASQATHTIICARLVTLQRSASLPPAET